MHKLNSNIGVGCANSLAKLNLAYTFFTSLAIIKLISFKSTD
jgi:hypothetical protein